MSMVMKKASAYPSSAVLVWFSVVAILVGHLTLTSSAGAGTRDDQGDAQGWDYLSDMSLQAHEPPGYQPTALLLAVVQPGRRGATELSGRRGVTEQEGRPGASPDHVGRETMTPGGRLRPIIIEALLNRKVSVPLMLDTGATYTVLTRQTAYDLGITTLERLPKQSFLTPGGPIQSPVTTLKSIQVGTAEARDVAVAIDAEGHLPMGLLGMTFMRHFKVTVDQLEGHVRFERR